VLSLSTSLIAGTPSGLTSYGLLTITLAAGTNRSERERVVCPSALRWELIWDTYKQTHAGAGRVTRCLQLQWFWPGMTRDVRLRVRKCEVCQASKYGRPTETAGRRRLHAGRLWQVVAEDLSGQSLGSAGILLFRLAGTDTL